MSQILACVHLAVMLEGACTIIVCQEQAVLYNRPKRAGFLALACDISLKKQCYAIGSCAYAHLCA